MNEKKRNVNDEALQVCVHACSMNNNGLGPNGAHRACVVHPCVEGNGVDDYCVLFHPPITSITVHAFVDGGVCKATVVST